MIFFSRIVSWVVDFVMEKEREPELNILEHFDPPKLPKLPLPLLPTVDNQSRPAHVYPCPPSKPAPPEKQQLPPEPPVTGKPFRPPYPGPDNFPLRVQQSPAIHRDSPVVIDMPDDIDSAPNIAFTNQRQYCGPPPPGFIPPEPFSPPPPGFTPPKPFSPPNSYVSPRNELEEMKERMGHLDTVFRLLMEERAALAQSISKLEESSLAMPVSPPPDQPPGVPVQMETPFATMRSEHPPPRIDWRLPLQITVPEPSNVPPMMELKTELTIGSEWEDICLE